MIRSFFIFLIAAFYFLAGIAHIKTPDPFIEITPNWVPFPYEVIIGTGIAEILGAIGLLIPQTRHAAAIGLTLYAVCVYPANLNHAFNDITVNGSNLSWRYHGPRLLFQPVLVWLPLWASRIINWPFPKKKTQP